MASDADRLIQAIPIESFLQRYLTLKQKGSNYWALCPFHNEKSPSFSISPEKGIFKCFGCGKGGNLITFVQEYEKVDFKESLKILSDYSGIPLQGAQKPGAEKIQNWKKTLIAVQGAVKEVYKSQLKDSEASEYIKLRKIEPATAAHFQLGYAPPTYRFLEGSLLNNYEGKKKQEAEKALFELGLLAKSSNDETYNRFRGRLIFPILGNKGETIAFGGRIIRKIEAGKYVNSPESPLFHKKATLYNFYTAKDDIRKSGQAILVEGYLDVMGLHQSGIKNAVAPLGTAFTSEQAKLLKRYTDNLIIFFDGDPAGIEAAYRSLVIARDKKLNPRIVILSGANQSLDPFDISQKLDLTEILSLLDASRTEVSFVLWYFFTHKYNISQLDQKREAIDAFFEYVGNLSAEWEKDEYLKEASVKLAISIDLIRNDFSKNGSAHIKLKRKRVEFDEEEIEQDYPVGSLEKEILSLLLRHSACWNNKVLLDEVEWSGKESYLLYVFFRDRLRSGEFWKWEDLNKVMTLLSDEGMVRLLSDILFSMETVFEELEESDDAAYIDKEYSKKLSRLIMLQKRERINKAIKQKTDELSNAEKQDPDKVDSLAEEVATLLGEKTKVEQFLASHS
ncbi:MAG: DNA primase [Leptospirales bacterium]